MPDRKCDDNANFGFAELVSALQQQCDAGIDVALDDIASAGQPEAIVEMSASPPDSTRPVPAPSLAVPVSASAAPASHVAPAPVQQAESLSACDTLDSLKHALETFDSCALKKTASNLVFADGNPDAELMIIGEAPGGDEDRMGLPFVGAAGQLLDKMLLSVGLRRTEVYITNILPWRPPGNRTPSTEEMQMLKPFLMRHIELKQPKLILALGGSSAKLLLDSTTGIMKLRGQIKTISTPNGQAYTVLPSLHPAYLLRAPAMKKLSYQDLLQLKSLLSADR